MKNRVADYSIGDREGLRLLGRTAGWRAFKGTDSSHRFVMEVAGTL